MNYDLRTWDGTAGTIECWIAGTQVLAEHAFYMFIGKVDQVTPEADAVAMWADVATLALNLRTGVDYSGKNTAAIVTAPGQTTLLGDAAQSPGKLTIPLDLLPGFNGATEQSSMCWIRATATGVDHGWVECEQPGVAPESYTMWQQRYDIAGFLAGGQNLIKYGVGVKEYETNSNRQTTQDQHIAVTWQAGAFPSLFVDGGSPEFHDGSTGTPTDPLSAAPGDLMKFMTQEEFAFGDWEGAMDEYIQFDRRLSQEFVNAAFENQKSTSNFLIIDQTEGADAVPGFVPDPIEPPEPQPTTDWEAFFADRTLPAIPTPDTDVQVSTWSALDSAIAAAAANTGNVGRIELTGNLSGLGSQQKTYNIQPNTTVIVDFSGAEINNSNNRVSMVYDGQFSNWNTGGDNSRITAVSTTNDKTTVTFLNPISGLEVGDWVKMFTPMIDSTTDWRLGSRIWSRTPSNNRAGQTLQVETIAGNTVTFTDYLRDPINQFPEIANAGRLWGAKYLCMGVDRGGALYLVDNKFRNTSYHNNIAVLALVGYHIIRPYIENNIKTPSYPSKVQMGGVRGKMYDAFFDSQLPAGFNNMGFCYAMNVLGGSSQNVYCNTDAFNRPYNMRSFRNYGDSSSFTLNTGMGDQEMARKAGDPFMWGMNRGIVKDSGGTGTQSTHSGSVATRFNAMQRSGPQTNLFMSFRSTAGQKYDDNIIEGVHLLATNFVTGAVFQFYNESADDASNNSNGSDNGCFGYLIRNNIIHWTSASFYYLSGTNATYGPLKFGSGNEIHIKKSGEIFFFNAGTSNDKPISQILPDPRPGWEVRGGSTYYVYNSSGGRSGSLRNGVQAHFDDPIYDLSARTSGSYTLMDVASGCTLTGRALLINPNNISVTPATGAGDHGSFTTLTI
jgi:hypothetical protein